MFENRDCKKSKIKIKDLKSQVQKDRETKTNSTTCGLKGFSQSQKLVCRFNIFKQNRNKQNKFENC